MATALEGLHQRFFVLGGDAAKDIAVLRRLFHLSRVATFELGPREKAEIGPETGLPGQARHRLRVVARDYLESDAVAAKLGRRFRRIRPQLISYRDQAERREAVR